MSQLKLPFITDIDDVKGKRILVRASLNVPLRNGEVRNQFRILRAVPTLLHLTQKKAKIILIAHIGRDKNETLRPVYEILKEHVSITWCDEVRGKKVREGIEEVKEGEVLFLENVRSEEGERKNSQAFAEELASYAEIYVNDAFPVSHREHATIVSIPKYLPSYLGLNFKEEYMHLMKMREPLPPSVFILGGAKFETKMPLIEKFVERYDQVFVGGALANDFFKAKGFEVGKSLVSDVDLSKSSLLSHPKIMLPIDVTVESGSSIRVSVPDEVTKKENIMDVGPATMSLLGRYIHNAHMVLWNGTLGNYEKGFGEYTKQCAKLIAESSAHSVIGGGDTIAVIEPLALNDHFTFVSSAGGAMLMLLEKGTLPGIEAIAGKNL